MVILSLVIFTFSFSHYIYTCKCAWTVHVIASLLFCFLFFDLYISVQDVFS